MLKHDVKYDPDPVFGKDNNGEVALHHAVRL
jgi:hypothetical protein